MRTGLGLMLSQRVHGLVGTYYDANEVEKASCDLDPHDVTAYYNLVRVPFQTT